MPLYENETRPSGPCWCLWTRGVRRPSVPGELEELSRTAGADPVLTFDPEAPPPRIPLPAWAPAWWEQAAELCRQEEIDLLLFDLELTPHPDPQPGEARCGSWTAPPLILDIFCPAGRSKEGQAAGGACPASVFASQAGRPGHGPVPVGGGIGTRALARPSWRRTAATSGGASAL